MKKRFEQAIINSPYLSLIKDLDTVYGCLGRVIVLFEYGDIRFPLSPNITNDKLISMRLIEVDIDERGNWHRLSQLGLAIAPDVIKYVDGED